MSRCEDIRKYLKSQSEPRSASEIANGIGMPGDIRVSYSLATMSREGTISKAGIGKRLVYAFVRDVVPRASGDAAAANRIAYERRRNEDRRKAREARRAREGLSDKPFELKKIAKPAAKLPPRKAIQLAVNRVKELSVAVAHEKKEAAAAPVRQRAETVDEFLARGGKIQVLHPWDTSKPLRFLDERFIDLD